MNRGLWMTTLSFLAVLIFFGAFPVFAASVVEFGGNSSPIGTITGDKVALEINSILKERNIVPTGEQANKMASMIEEGKDAQNIVNNVFGASPDVSGYTLNVPNPVKADNLTELLADVANFIFIIAIPIAVIVILISGIRYLLAGGNEDKINSARRALVWAAVGLVIILIGKGIISVIQSLLSVTVK